MDSTIGGATAVSAMRLDGFALRSNNLICQIVSDKKCEDKIYGGDLRATERHKL